SWRTRTGGVGGRSSARTLASRGATAGAGTGPGGSGGKGRRSRTSPGNWGPTWIPSRNGSPNGRGEQPVRKTARGRAFLTLGDAEEAFQATGDLAVRQPGLLVEFDDRCLGIRPQLGCGGAEGVGCLQGMAALDAATAMATLPDVDVELPVDGLARDLDLEL